jgi:hypothetical protein
VAEVSCDLVFDQEGFKLDQVRRTCKFAAVTLALALWGSPLLDCMLRADALTEQERECCQEMADQCGPATMPSSHSCCKELPQSGSSSFLLGKSKNLCPEAAQPLVVIDMAPGLQPELALAIAHDLHAPFASPPGRQTVLRI